MSSRRVQKELEEINRHGGVYDGGAVRIKAESSDRMRRWHAWIKGPDDTPFQGGVFQIKIVLPHDYPMAPPQASFATKIFHPNVHFDSGEICLDVLKQAWSPAWTIPSLCQAIRTLMNHPEATSPLNCDAGNMLRAGDTRAFDSLARMYTIEEAAPTAPVGRGRSARGAPPGW
eukprot:TRINITY_DN7031_c0_g1_i1.p1 TRINITY_DN7031_c0_g1~~TRINITY_DN7031_c0_g1_i1.p1  ORF type:complete len:203 (+),score=50.68 TRINITY_DN7031_c0_g1_i1:91-609(+)